VNAPYIMDPRPLLALLAVAGAGVGALLWLAWRRGRACYNRSKPPQDGLG